MIMMNCVFRCVSKCSLIHKNVFLSYQFSSSVVYRDKLTEASQVKPGYQSVADFYAEKSVFLTGGTGLIGKLTIERLLYNCKDLENIYILIRAKKNSSIHQRLEEMLQNPIFSKLKKARPHVLNKIVPIAGDVSDIRLGMSPDDEQTLIEKVSVIFHSAANVIFSVPLHDQMQTNYEGTKKVLELGKKIKHLDVFVHVSTTFHNTYRVIDEFPHPPLKNIEDVYRVIDNHSNETEEIRKLLGKLGNKYLFSKNMAEAYVARNHGNIPTVIARPSMVTAIYKNPLAGYTESWVPASTILSDAASGLLRIAYGKKDTVVDIVPADYVSNFLIIAAAKNARRTKCNVYNISSGHSNPIEWSKLSDIFIKESKKNDYAIIPFPKLFVTKARWVIPVMMFVTQIVPAFTADVWLRLTGRPSRYMKLQKKVTSRIAVTTEETPVKSWEIIPYDIRTTKARELLSTLSNEDRDTFPCDPVTIDWDRYVPIHCKGIKDYMLEQNKNEIK